MTMIDEILAMKEELRSLRAENADLRDRLTELRRGSTFDQQRVDTELERLRAIARASGHFKDL